MVDIADYQLVGFSGSRDVTLEMEVAIAAAVSEVQGRVVVGCAKGVDAFVRSLVPDAEVFRASDFGKGRSSFARRSIAMVDAIATCKGVLVSFPARPCPDGLFPSDRSSKAFCGKGSGTWATLAYAIGSDVPVLVPHLTFAPPSWLREVGDRYEASVEKQLSLF